MQATRGRGGGRRERERDAPTARASIDNDADRESEHRRRRRRPRDRGGGCPAAASPRRAMKEAVEPPTPSRARALSPRHRPAAGGCPRDNAPRGGATTSPIQDQEGEGEGEGGGGGEWKNAPRARPLPSRRGSARPRRESGPAGARSRFDRSRARSLSRGVALSPFVVRQFLMNDAL